MGSRRYVRIFYSDLDRLYCEAVYPAIIHVRHGVQRASCDRQFAGGPHWCVSLLGEEDGVDTAAATLAATARAYLQQRPSPDLTTYSSDRAADLLRREGEPASTCALRYRNNTLEEWGPPPRQYEYASPEAAELAEEARHDMATLMMLVLSSRAGKFREMLRAFLWYAIAAGGGNAAGMCVTFRSHWEGFANDFPEPLVIERLRRAQRDNEAAVREELARALSLHESGRFVSDPIIAAWDRILRDYAVKVRQLLADGVTLTRQPSTLEEARAIRESRATLPRKSSFVAASWSDERFMASIQFEHDFLTARVLVNLLYMLVAAVGLTPIDKMALCHHAHCAIERHYGCDAEDLLRRHISAVVARHAHRWTA